MEAGWACAQEHTMARRPVSGHWRAASGRQGGSGSGEGGHSVWGRSRAQRSAWKGTREKTRAELVMPGNTAPRLDLQEKRLGSLHCLLLQHAVDGFPVTSCKSATRGERVISNEQKTDAQSGQGLLTALQ